MKHDRIKILIADDSRMVRTMYRHVFPEERYDLLLKENGKEALDGVDGFSPDIILLDVEMPVMDGITACGEILKRQNDFFIPVLMVTSLKDKETITQIFQAGAHDYLNKPFHEEEMVARVEAHVRMKRMIAGQKKLKEALVQTNKGLDNKVKERTRTIEETQEALLIGMAKLAEFRDPDTGAHIERTRALCMALAVAASMDERFVDQITSDFIENLYKSAPLHDIGKVGVPDHILGKPGKLTPEEFQRMKEHSRIGGTAIVEAEKSLSGTSFLETAKNIALYHHERFDGQGYPFGLSGEKIPLEARIMAIADMYDALVSRRVYKPPLPHQEALPIIQEEAGKHLDPRLVEVFIRIEQEVEEIGKAGAGADEI